MSVILLCLLVLGSIAACRADAGAPTVDATVTAVRAATYPGANGRVFTIQRPGRHEFVSLLAVHVGFATAEEEMCLFVEIGRVGEMVGTADEVYRHFIRGTVYRFVVDGVDFSETGDRYYYVSDLVQRLSPEGTPIPGFLQYCFETINLAEGDHTATLELTDMTGITHAYSWTFQITTTQ